MVAYHFTYSRLERYALVFDVQYEGWLLAGPLEMRMQRSLLNENTYRWLGQPEDARVAEWRTK